MPLSRDGRKTSRKLRETVSGPANKTGAASRPPPSQGRIRASSGLFVERRLDLGGLGRLERIVTVTAVRLRLAAEVEAEGREVGSLAVRPDLLECGEQLLLGRRPLEGGGRHVLARADLDRPVLLQPRRRRDQLPDDDVLLQAEQPVDLALDRGVGQHLRRLLEGGRRQEGLRRERGLRDAEDERLVRRRLLLRPGYLR